MVLGLPSSLDAFTNTYTVSFLGSAVLRYGGMITFGFKDWFMLDINHQRDFIIFWPAVTEACVRQKLVLGRVEETRAEMHLRVTVRFPQ